MKKLSFILIIILGLGLSSCSVGRYVNPSQNLNLNQTQVVLSEANFKVVKRVSTTVIYRQSAMRFNADQLYQSAYAELLKKANLTGSQALINVTAELVSRITGFSFFYKEDCAILVSGIVIEFIDKDAPTLTLSAPLDEIIEDSDVISGGTIVSSPSTIETGETITLVKDIVIDKSIKDLLHIHKVATFVVEDKNLPQSWIKRYQNNFLKTYNSVNTSAFALTTSQQDLVVKLVFTDRTNERQTAHIEFLDKAGKELAFYELGTEATIQGFANKFAEMVQWYLK